MSSPDWPQYDEELVVQYLLGSIPEEEATRLDELAFVNDEFAERLRAVEYDLVDAYVKGELSGEVLDRFQSHYLTSPARREKVKFAESLLAWSNRTPEISARSAPVATPAVVHLPLWHLPPPRASCWRADTCCTTIRG